MSTESDNIERDAGQIVGGYRVGGGYRGKREDQDEAVCEFAERLADMFPHDVTIRYNTNRLGGGAWLKDNARHAQVGLGAELKAPESHQQKVQEAIDNGKSLRDIDKDYSTEDMNLVYTVHLVEPSVDAEYADKESGFSNKNDYTHRSFDTLETAWGWFCEQVNRDGVNPPAED